MTTTVILTYTMTLFGTIFPAHTMVMDSVEACASAQSSLLSSPLASSVQANGGTLEVTCKVETK